MKIERCWDTGRWANAARVARWLASGVSMMMAVHYLQSLDVPWLAARSILLGV